MFTLPSQPTTGVFASKEAGLELTSPARSRKNARNFTNRMAHSLLTAVTFVHLPPKSPRVRSKVKGYVNCTLASMPRPCPVYLPQPLPQTRSKARTQHAAAQND